MASAPHTLPDRVRTTVVSPMVSTMVSGAVREGSASAPQAVSAIVVTTAAGSVNGLARMVSALLLSMIRGDGVHVEGRSGSPKQITKLFVSTIEGGRRDVNYVLRSVTTGTRPQASAWVRRYSTGIIRGPAGPCNTECTLKRVHLTLVALPLMAVAQPAHALQKGFSVGGRIGTLGIGPEVAVPVGSGITLRGGAGLLGFDLDMTGRFGLADQRTAKLFFPKAFYTLGADVSLGGTARGARAC